MTGYAPEGAAAVIELVTPIAMAVGSLWPSRRGHWSGLVLAAPPLIIGILFLWALAKSGLGYGGGVILIYALLLLIVSIASIAFWIGRRQTVQ